jgi:hypothetical protein
LCYLPGRFWYCQRTSRICTIYTSRQGHSVLRSRSVSLGCLSTVHHLVIGSSKIGRLGDVTMLILPVFLRSQLTLSPPGPSTCSYPTSTNSINPPPGIDLIITLGGDGTILHLSSLYSTAGSVPPVLSFSMGSLGFLLPFRTFRPFSCAGHD